MSAPEPTPSTEPAPSTADRSVSEVEDDLASKGYDAEFGAREGGRILCFTCRAEFGAADVDADHAARVEGESDPADMAIVVPVECPACGAEGALQLQYGPQATEAEADTLLALERTPSTEYTPDDAA